VIIQTEIHLDKFKPRNFQLPLCDALENKGFKKLLAIWPRRAGKDLCAWNLMIRQAVRKVGVYMYCLPTFRQAKLVIFDNITNDQFKMIDFIPKELIKAINSQELKITLSNGSIIQLIGSDSYDTSLVGTNPRMVVFSEYALADPRAYHFVRPILNANGGTMIILSTPRGKNGLWELYNIARNSPDWFCNKLTLEDTKHISWEDIQKEIESGEISQDLAMQEYFCSFDQGVEGSFYAKYIDASRVAGRVSTVPWEPAFKVDTAWDIGVRDSTCIIFFQRIGTTIRIIDCYEKSKEGLEHYVKVLEMKPYSYGKHWAPHDIAVKEFGSGLTRLEKAKQLGIKFETRDGGKSSALPNISIEDGIEAVRSKLPLMYFDEMATKPLVRALENYRQEWDSKKKIYKSAPLHDNASHFSDAMRYLVLSLSRCRDEQSTAEDIEKRYREAQGYGGDGLGAGQGFFNDQHRIY
jgi:phage terminase large subunit